MLISLNNYSSVVIMKYRQTWAATLIKRWKLWFWSLGEISNVSSRAAEMREIDFIRVPYVSLYVCVCARLYSWGSLLCFFASVHASSSADGGVDSPVFTSDSSDCHTKQTCVTGTSQLIHGSLTLIHCAMYDVQEPQNHSVCLWRCSIKYEDLVTVCLWWYISNVS